MWILNHWTTSEVPEESVNSPSDHILILNHYHTWLDTDWGAQGGTPRSLGLSFCSGKGSRDGRGQEEPGWQTLEVARRVRLLRFKFTLPHLLAVALISLGPTFVTMDPIIFLLQKAGVHHHVTLNSSAATDSSGTLGQVPLRGLQCLHLSNGGIPVSLED